MICQPCEKAGEWNSMWRTHQGAYYLTLAEECHAMCKGCPCQHAVGVDSLVVTLP